ncbi:MAG TPA: hypothetical protein VF174_08650 [Micromonosporaceae bacterium]
MKVEPVRWMGLILAALVALSGVEAFLDLLPSWARAALAAAIAVLTAVLAEATREKVTPLARPRDAAGQPLVPTWAQKTPGGV